MSQLGAGALVEGCKLQRANRGEAEFCGVAAARIKCWSSDLSLVIQSNWSKRQNSAVARLTEYVVDHGNHSDIEIMLQMLRR